MLDADNQLITVQSHSGTQLFGFTPSDYTELEWTREYRDVSSSAVTVPSVDGHRDITPWLHWLSFWDSAAANLLWTGPVLKTTVGKAETLIEARDIGAFMARTRTPITKQWAGADLGEIAGELWAPLIEMHGLSTAPIVNADPAAGRFSFAVTADEDTLDTVFHKMVQLGLKWTVSSNVAVFGPLFTDPRHTLTTLGEQDFVGGGIQLVRDGSATYNDVLLRGTRNLARARIPMADINLQTVVDINEITDVSSVNHATQQYARFASKVRDAVHLPHNASLHPEAPVSINQLIPGMRFAVEAYGTLSLMELESVQVSSRPGSGGAAGGTAVKVSMESVNLNEPELADFVQGRF